MIVECVKKVVVDQGFELGFHAWESGLVTIIPQSFACGRGDKYLIVCCWERERTMIMNMARKEIAYRSCRDFLSWWIRYSCLLFVTNDDDDENLVFIVCHEERSLRMIVCEKWRGYVITLIFILMEVYYYRLCWRTFVHSCWKNYTINSQTTIFIPYRSWETTVNRGKRWIELSW